jgi:hypothetical protein
MSGDIYISGKSSNNKITITGSGEKKNIDLSTKEANNNLATQNNNAKYYSDKALESANKAEQSAVEAENSALQAKENAIFYSSYSKIWAEGTDEEVQALGGEHSSKTWAEIGGSGGEWGSIQGDISNQTDLKLALENKQDILDVYTATEIENLWGSI